MRNAGTIYWWIIILFVSVSCKNQNQTAPSEKQEIHYDNDKPHNSGPSTFDTLYRDNAPGTITRSIIQDKTGNLWFATFGGIFKYDGHQFTNISKEVSQSRFFSALEDNKGHLWFGSIGSGVYSYQDASIQNFTTDDGLINNEIVWIYEDKIGQLWLGANGGVSVFYGKKIRNYLISGDTIREDNKGTVVPNLQRPPNEVNAIIEDLKGNIWLATRGNTFIYDGTSFTTIAFDGKPFENVRSIIADKNGNIWLGGNDGLWKFDGTTFTNFTTDFVGYIYQDSHENIWTSSESVAGWSLCRYDAANLSNPSKAPTIIKSGQEMLFGIFEDAKGNIWSGTLDGVCFFDGNTFTCFKPN